MLKITVQLANGDQIDFTTKDVVSEWKVNGEIEIPDGIQTELDTLYGYAEVLAY